MKKKFSALLALALTMVLCLTLGVVTAFADDATETYEAYDVVTIDELGIASGATGVSGEKGYEGTSATKSVMLKFFWDASLVGNGFQIALDRGWSQTAMVWFQAGEINAAFGPKLENGDPNYTKFAGYSSGLHLVEFARLRVATGSNAGKDHLYIKIDGEMKAEIYTDYFQTAGGYNNGYGDMTTPSYTIGFVGDSAAEQKFYKPDYDPAAEPETFAAHDEVDLLDLGFTSATLTGWPTFTYAQSEESMILSFSYTATLPEGTEAGWQIITRAGTVWFRRDQAYLIPNGADAKGGGPVLNSGEHTIEVGVMRVATGANVGKDYVYYKVDGVEIASSYATPNGDMNGKVQFGGADIADQTFVVPEPEPETYATFDAIGLGDLGVFSATMPEGEGNVFYYEYTSTTNSVVLTFEVDMNVASDKGWQIMLDSKWNENYILWFRNDNTYLHTVETGYVTATAVTSGKHEVEFGRLRVATGVNAGKDYVYHKLDGELVLSAYVTPADATSGAIWFRGGEIANQTFTIPVQAETYEAYDEVSLATLGITSNVIAHNVDWNVEKEAFDNAKFNYEGTSDTYSIKLTFEWEAAQSASEVNWQLILDGKWNTSCLFYFTPDQIAIYNAAGEVTNIAAITSGKHSVEVARLRVKTGAAAGKDHLYLKVDGEVLFQRFQRVSDVDQYTVTFRGDYIESQRFADHFYNEGSVLTESTACNVAGQKKYTCAVCNHEKTEDYYLEHTYSELIAEVPANCTDDGVAAHYECSVCDKLFDTDKNEKTAAELVIDALGHDLTHVVATEATCCAQGTVEHYSCSICEKNFNADLEEIEIYIDINSEAHKWGEWVVTKEATTTEEGVETRTCANDPTHVEERPIEKLPSQAKGCFGSVGSTWLSALALIAVAVGYSIVSRKRRNNQ